MKDLLQRIADVLTEMSLLAEGHTTSFDAKVSGGGEPDALPRRVETLLDQYAGSMGEFRLLLFRAERDLQRYKGIHRKPPGEWKEERDARIVEKYVGWESAKVAAFEDLSNSQVRRIREKANKNPKDGRPWQPWLEDAA